VHDRDRPREQRNDAMNIAKNNKFTTVETWGPDTIDRRVGGAQNAPDAARNFPKENMIPKNYRFSSAPNSKTIGGGTATASARLRDECLLVRMKLACGSMEANSRL
jgi:hypothetical protein